MLGYDARPSKDENPRADRPRGFLSLCKDAERSAEVRPVVAVQGKTLAILRDHIHRRLGRKPEDVDVRRLGVDLIDMFLAVVACHALLVVVLKERVGSCAIDPDVVRLDDPDSPGRLVRFGAHVWIEVLVVLLERLESIRIGLVVGRLGLNGPKVDILSTLEVVLGENRVLGGGAV